MKLKGATRQRYETKAQVMKALAHPTRLFMVDEHSNGERCVCELREVFSDYLVVITDLVDQARPAENELQSTQKQGWKRKMIGDQGDEEHNTDRPPRFGDSRGHARGPRGRDLGRTVWIHWRRLREADAATGDP